MSKRTLRIALGVLWLLDGGLQFEGSLRVMRRIQTPGPS